MIKKNIGLWGKWLGQEGRDMDQLLTLLGKYKFKFVKTTKQLEIGCVTSKLVEEKEKELGKLDNPKEEQKGKKNSLQ